MLLNHANLAELFVGFKSTFSRGFELASPIYKSVAMVIPSTTERNRYDWLGAAPGMREWLGDRVINNLRTHGFQIENRDWESTIGVDRNKIEDDQYGVYSPWMQRMGESAAYHPDELVFGLINDGREATSLCYDGLPFFSASHPYDPGVTFNGSGVQSNVDTGSGPYWYVADLSSTIRPIIFQSRKNPEFVSKMALTDDNVFFQKEYLMGVDARYNAGYGLWQQMYADGDALTADELESAITALNNFRAPNGKAGKWRATHLIVPSSLEFTARRLLESALLQGAGLVSATDNILRGSLQLIVAKELDLT